MGIPTLAHALASALSPSGCAMRASAAGAAHTGSRAPCPSMRVSVRTARTSTSARGRNQMRSSHSRFARCVIRSVAADE
jgi:hypothetical protein